MTQKTVSIIGCGWLGTPLAENLIAAGYTVKGSTTTTDKLPSLRKKGVDAHQLNLNPNPVGDLDGLLKADIVVINVPPKAGKMGDGFHPEQVRYLADALHQSTVAHVIYVSSTSVYPELSRVMVEDDVKIPDESAAPSLVQAEQYIHQLTHTCLTTVLRCGGLMGYDRIPGKYVAGRTVDSGAVPVNYLHLNDAVGLLTSVIKLGLTGTYNAVAPEHPTREAIYRKSCADFGYQLPTFVTPEKPVPYKTISVEKLIKATNYSFVYSDPLQFLYQL